MNRKIEWAEVMEGLRGRRLAVLDELTRGFRVNTDDLKVQESLGWLVYHRLVWHDGTTYAPRSTGEARTLWLREGPAKTDAAAVGRVGDYVNEMAKAAEASPPIPPEIRAKMDADREEARRVHTHQSQLFD